MDIAEIRKQYPQYADLPDEKLAKGFHDKFYSDMPYETFAAKIGLGAQAEKKSRNWVDVPREALINLPSSAGKFAEGIYQTVRHPIDTASGLLDVAAGGLRNLTPEPLRNAIEGGQPSEAALRATDSANALASIYKNRYGSAAGLKETLATDPVGAAADLSTVLAGGAGLARRMPGGMAGANALSGMSNLTNPVTPAVAAAKAVAPTLATVGKTVFGATTGVGPENIGNAAKAGFEGKRAFWDNMTGAVSPTEVLDAAKGALQNMRFDRSANYKQNIAATAANQKKVNFAPIDTALADVVDSLKVSGAGTPKWKIGDAEVNDINKLRQVVTEWRLDQSLHTPMGLDALKQRLDSLYPESPMHNQAQRAISAVRNEVKKTIVDASPEYAKTMSQYEEALTLENEIKRALSLNNKASADTALRKLQSLSRNNVNTNYGYRLELAKALEEKGGADLMPSISGQAMNSWTGRGMAGMFGPATLGAAYLSNPHALALLPFQSPKLMGAAAYLGGRAASALPAMSPQIKLNALLGSQAGNISLADLANSTRGQQ